MIDEQPALPRCKHTVDELVADTCSPEVMREYVRLTAPPKALMDALRMQVHQLEMKMLCGGPSEICDGLCWCCDPISTCWKQ